MSYRVIRAFQCRSSVGHLSLFGTVIYFKDVPLVSSYYAGKIICSFGVEEWPELIKVKCISAFDDLRPLFCMCSTSCFPCYFSKYHLRASRYLDSKGKRWNYLDKSGLSPYRKLVAARIYFSSMSVN